MWRIFGLQCTKWRCFSIFQNFSICHLIVVKIVLNEVSSNSSFFTPDLVSGKILVAELWPKNSNQKQHSLNCCILQKSWGISWTYSFLLKIQTIISSSQVDVVRCVSFISQGNERYLKNNLRYWIVFLTYIFIYGQDTYKHYA